MKTGAQLSGLMGNTIKMSHFVMSSARWVCVFSLHPHGPLWDKTRGFLLLLVPHQRYPVIQPVSVFLSGRMCMNGSPKTRGWDKPGLRVEIFKRFFIVFPLNPLFSSAHIWLWFGTNVGVFTDGRSESCDAHNNTDPPLPVTALIMPLNVRADSRCSPLHLSRLSASPKLRSA